MKDRLAPPIPHEHGAWALLYGPFVMAVAASGHFDLRTAILWVTLTSLFLAHEPFAKLVRISRHGVRADLKRHWQQWLVIYGALSALGTLLLLAVFRQWQLLPLGGAAALLLGLHLWLTSRRRERHLAGELIGVVGLTATGPAAYSLASGQIDGTAGLIWLLSILYFASGIFSVKMRVSRFLKKQEFPTRRLHSLLYHSASLGVLLLLVSTRHVSVWLPLAYVPMLLRALWPIVRPDPELNLRRIGYSEVALTLLFVTSFALLWHR